MSKVLKNLLRSGEGEQNDFKLTISKPEKIAKTLTAFANHLGGTLVVGVRDDRVVIGIDPEEEKYMLEQAAKHFCEPPVQINYQTIFLPTKEEVEMDEVAILIAQVPMSKIRPHYVREKNGQQTLYIRQADQSIPASQAITQQLQKGTYQPKPYKKPNSVKDPNAKRVMAYLQHSPRITVKLAAKKLNMSERRAQRLLQEMSEKGILRAHDHEKEIYFTR
ncbi:MAG TPA: AAA family ATPase [Cytophagales bacterium]|nr:AAA family ATPase [Cytophagales bacterium]HAA24331.1 AAA family ATPase [Cytophagales bacterium]HAP63988.1 AAA family ATPase [Cytophagales bacterium]